MLIMPPFITNTYNVQHNHLLTYLSYCLYQTPHAELANSPIYNVGEILKSLLGVYKKHQTGSDSE